MLFRLSLRLRISIKTSSRKKVISEKKKNQQNVNFGTFIAFWMLSLDCPNFYLINLSAIFALTTVHTGTIWKIWGYLLGPWLSLLQYIWFCMQAGLSPRCCQLRDTAALRCIVGNNKKPWAVHVQDLTECNCFFNPLTLFYTFGLRIASLHCFSTQQFLHLF